MCIPDPPGPCVRPFHDRADRERAAAPTGQQRDRDIDGGKMDGFAEQQRGTAQLPINVQPGLRHQKRPPDVMGYHAGRRSPTTGRTPSDFVLQDHMFESTLVEPAGPPVHGLGVVRALHAARPVVRTREPRPARLPSAGGSPFVCPFAWTDLTYLLHKDGVSWGYYVFTAPSPIARTAQRSDARPSPERHPGDLESAAGLHDVKHDGQLGNIQPLISFFETVHDRIAAGGLMDRPNSRVSEHPPASSAPDRRTSPG